ncbi:hypothetical protein [Lelliottia nimipressuralis]|uniref:Uncharacterized protein n=1 Tax=Lelliottia nimipressuralis TaxID=69220 RepID=A0ABD4KFZ7_9ENTR|nr:hypothetical protein [Lelliottia nimipressuralis]MBF4180801.1 hypothetical protein [Lelliottia nimipressuralis]
MNVNDSKAAALLNAAQRSTQPERQTSSGSISNNQSEVTSKPPTIYQVPKINTPGNMEEAAKLLQRELTSIAQSQSIIVTIWEEYLAQRKELTHLVRQVDEMQTALRWNGIEL